MSKRGRKPNASKFERNPDSSRETTPGSISKSNGAKRGRKSGSRRGARGSRMSREGTPDSVISESRRRSIVKPGKKSSRGGKNGTASGRGYNSSQYFKDDDYHYGSDFEESDGEDISRVQDDSEDSDSSERTNVNDFEPDENITFDGELSETKIPTPVPFWLRDDLVLPDLNLPDSSCDLLVPKEHILEVFSIYEVLRQFSSLIRLTPFRVEDFCAALMENEQSNLISEIHISLLKALLREDDNQLTQFGPLDQKDSINAVLNFVDVLTWPQCLKEYLSSSPDYGSCYELIQNTNYPFGPLVLRIKILKYLTDFILTTSVVRDHISTDGGMSNYEEYCRVCLKIGDLISCNMCSAACHGTCIEPNVEDDEAEDWTCNTCIEHQQIEGVENTSLGGVQRNKILGYDRNGYKYWFICRRIVIENFENSENDESDFEIFYYSSIAQVERLLSRLDGDNYEKDLCESFNEVFEEIKREMTITEKLTTLKKPFSKDSYLQAEDQKIKLEIQIEEENKIKEMEEKMKLEQEEEDKKVDLIKTEETVVCETVPEMEIKKEELESEDNKDEVQQTIMQHTTRLKTGSLQPKSYTAEDARKSKYVEELKDKIKLRSHGKDLLFKLGQDGDFRQYSNQYSVNSYALSRSQQKEESEKRRFLSYKFSLTSVSEFKWSGNLYGIQISLIKTLRQTLHQLENNIPTTFMHPNWPLLRKPWIGAVGNSTTPREFSRALTVLQSCIKPVIFLPVWSDSIGHTELRKITHLEREERKKKEKKKKREEDEIEEKNRASATFVKYTLGVKHQIFKQKGEEYRIHGQWGWLWMSKFRNWQPKDFRTVGLLAGPHKVAVNLIEKNSGKSKTVLVELKVWNAIQEKQSEDHVKVEVNKTDDDVSSSASDSEKPDFVKSEKTPTDIDNFIDKMLANYLVEAQVIPSEYLDPIIDVSFGLSHASRTIYSKCAAKCKIDDLLARRIQLKSLEERRLDIKDKKDGENETETTITSDLLPEKDTKQKTILTATKVTVGKVIKSFSSFKFHPCYSYGCAQGSPLPCYSMTCKINSKRVAAATVILEKLKSQLKENGVIIQDTLPLKSVKDVLKIFDEILSSVNKYLDISPSDNKENDSPSAVAPQEKSNLPVRKFSSQDTSQKLYLKRIQSVADAKKNNRIIKYPLSSHFTIKSKGKKSCLILAKHELKHMARTCGYKQVEGFLYNSKPNTQMWPYPCPRPSFSTVWLWRNSIMSSMQAVMLQLRIIWASLRWDDMNQKNTSLDGKNQITTEKGIITTELLKHRNQGRFLEKTQYFQRKVVIPLEVPKSFVPVEPVRSGLRKRKRQETPTKADPQVQEEWIDENQLELWAIKAYREKLEREKVQSITRTKTGNLPKKIERSESPPVTKKESKGRDSVQKTQAKTDDKTKFKTLTLQQEVQKKITPLTGKSLIQNTKSPKPSILSKPQPTLTTVSSPPAQINQQQKVQIVKLSDGKIQVRGLMPGQKLVKMPDGTLQIISKNDSTPNIIPSTSTSNTLTKPVQLQQPKSSLVFKSSDTNKLKPLNAVANNIISSPNANVVASNSPTVGLVQSPRPNNSPKTAVQVMSLGNNEVTMANGQWIVKGPDQASAEFIAKQLSSGKTKLAQINGKQVLITMNSIPQPNIAPATKTILPSVPIAPVPESTPAPLPSPPKPPPSTDTSEMAVFPSNATAQLIQTPQGPRIVLQGLQGIKLSQEQLMTIQQQVKTQLLKAQQVARAQGKIPPTKVALQLQTLVKEDTPKVDNQESQLPPALPSFQQNNLAKDDVNENDFQVTNDYIQETIQSALKEENLSPEIEQKLLALQKHQFDSSPPKKKGKKVQPIDPASGEVMDAEWKPHTSQKNKLKRKSEEVVHSSNLEAAEPLPEKSMLKAKARRMMSPANTEKKRQQLQGKLFLLLTNHKEKLKKDILKKRSNLENTLMADIHKDIQIAEKILHGKSSEDNYSSSPNSKSQPSQTSKTTPKRGRSSKKENKLYCTCKTAYDPTKFYVGCDSCNNWFHGSCVNISEEMSLTMTEFVCESCKQAKEKQEIYCICKQPYDERLFYIGCEMCSDWFHGRCVGVLQAEAENIDEYLCPNCDKNTRINYSNSKPLVQKKDYEEVRKLLRQLQSHRNSWPFKQPVDPVEAPGYYDAVTAPMDLQTIEQKLSQKKYKNLIEFIADVSKIFDNCRYFNAPGSQFFRCAENLEHFFSQKVQIVRSKL